MAAPMSATAACNLVLTNYQVVVKALDIATKIPATLVKTAKKLAEQAEEAGLGTLSEIASWGIGLANIISLPMTPSDPYIISDILSCPLITALTPEEDRASWQNTVKDIREGTIDADQAMNLKEIKNGLNQGATEVQSLISEKMSSNVYVQLMDINEQINNMLWEDLSAIGLPGDSIMSLMGYLKMGEQCLSQLCESIQLGESKYQEFMDKLSLNDSPSGPKFDLVSKFPSEVQDTLADAAVSVAEPMLAVKDAFSGVPAAGETSPFTKPWE